MRRSSYNLTIDGEHKIVLVVDLRRPGHPSVTNDAEHVVADLVQMGIDVDHYRIIYRDGSGTWDGMNTRNGKFVAFYQIGAMDRTEAIFMAMTRRTPAQLAEAGG